MIYKKTFEKGIIPLLLCATLCVKMTAAAIINLAQTSTTAYDGLVTSTYSTEVVGALFGLAGSTIYYIETPYSTYPVNIYSQWAQTTTSTYLTQDKYYYGSDNTGTHATVYYVITPQSNDISVVTTYGTYTTTSTFSTQYNLVSSQVSLDDTGLSTFGLGSSVTSTLTTYYVATPLPRSFTTFFFASSVVSSETVSIIDNVVTNGPSIYVLESIYVATPINPLVSSSIGFYAGSTVTTYKTSKSTDADSQVQTIYYINSPYPVTQITGYNYWDNNYSTLSTASAYLTTNAAGSTVSQQYYVIYEPTPQQVVTSFTYWPGASTSTYSSDFQTTSNLIFSIDLSNLLFFWRWFHETTMTFTTFYVKTPYSSVVINSYSYQHSINAASTYKTQTTTVFGINNKPTIETIYYIATPLADDQSISYSYWNGNGIVTISTTVISGTTVDIVLVPYPSTTIHSVTTNVPSITAIGTYSTAIFTTVISGSTYIATIFDINVPSITTISSVITQVSSASAITTVSSTTNIGTVVTPANVFDGQTSDIINTYTYTTYTIQYPLSTVITDSSIVGLSATTYSTSVSYVTVNAATTESITVYHIATPVATTFTSTFTSNGIPGSEVVSFYSTTDANGKPVLTSGNSVIPAPITAPTTFTTTVANDVTTYTEAVSYYTTAGDDGKPTLTSGSSIIVVQSSIPATSVISPVYKSSVSVTSLSTSSYVGPRYTNSSTVAVSTSSTSALTAPVTSETFESSSADSTSIFTSVSGSSALSTSVFTSVSGSSLDSATSGQSASVFTSVSGSSVSSESTSAQSASTPVSASSSASTTSVCATDALVNQIIKETAYYNMTVKFMDVSEFYVVADLDQSAGGASLSFGLYSGCSNVFTSISENVIEDKSTATKLWQSIELPQSPSEMDGLVDGKLIVPLVDGTVSTEQLIHFVVPITTSKRDTAPGSYMVYTITMEATTDGKNFSTNEYTSRIISPAEAASKFGISASSSSDSTTSAISTTYTGAPQSESTTTSGTGIITFTSSGATSTGTAASSTSKPSSQVSSATSGSGSQSQASNGSGASLTTSSVSDEHTTLMTVANCGTKTCTVPVSSAPAVGPITCTAVSPVGPNTGASPASGTAVPTAVPSTLVSVTQSIPSPVITTLSPYNNGAISNIKRSGFLRNVILLVMSVMFFM